MQLDVALAILPLPARPALFGKLPQSARWRALHARTPARSGTVRTTLLSNRRHTLAVLGYLKPEASAFARLSLAGRMLKEAAGHNPERIGSYRHRRGCLRAGGARGSARCGPRACLRAAELSRARAR